MQNIPTDLLRTLVAVVDLRSFTKAAQSLGVTQPAVSAQIKRLQFLLGYELLDKSAPGRESDAARARSSSSMRAGCCRSTTRSCSLTSGGRRRRRCGSAFRATFAGSRIPADARRFPQALAGRRFIVSATSSDNMLRELKQGDLDLASRSRRRSPRSRRVTSGSTRRSGCAATPPRSIRTGRCRWCRLARTARAAYAAGACAASGRARLRLRVHVAQRGRSLEAAVAAGSA